MQALAIYGRPVSSAAVDYLLQPYVTGVDSASTLGRLVNMHFVRRETGRYYLHPVDRSFALDRVPLGHEEQAISTGSPPFTRFSLWHRGAEYFKKARMPREEWKSIADLEAQLAEFELRCAGGDYDVAATVLSEIGPNHLYLWGHNNLLVAMYERLSGRVQDPPLNGVVIAGLAVTYMGLGRFSEAIPLLEQAIVSARELNNPSAEANRMDALGGCFSWLGQTQRAIVHSQKALELAKQSGDMRSQAYRLSNVGVYYFYLADTQKAMTCFSEALEMARNAGSRVLEGIIFNNIAVLVWDQGEWHRATELYELAIQLNDETKNVKFQNEARLGLARTKLMTRDLAAARRWAEEALQYQNPENMFNVWSQLGVIALCQGDVERAPIAFSNAITEAESILKHNQNNYKARDALGLALCGITLCGTGDRIPEAVHAFQMTRLVNSDIAYVRRLVRMLDAMSGADKAGVLHAARQAVGQTSQV